jgi:hypothetical protein
MFKVRMLQTVRNLSDGRAELLIQDRLSFMPSFGLGPSGSIPRPDWPGCLVAVVPAQVGTSSSCRGEARLRGNDEG